MRGIGVALLLAAPLLARADVRRFGWLDEPGVLKDGQVEIETSMTLGMGREGAEDVTFRTYRPALQLQAGLSDRVQLTVGTQLLSALQVSDSYYGDFGPYGRVSYLSLVEEMTAQLELRLGSPADPGGASFVFGLGAFNQGAFQAATLGLRFAHASPSLVLAAEVLALPGFVVQPGTDQLELRSALRLGLSGHVGGSAWLGLELRGEGYISLTSDDRLLDESFLAIYLGPTLSVVRDRFWLTLAVEPQLPSPITQDSDKYAPLEIVAARAWLAGTF